MIDADDLIKSMNAAGIPSITVTLDDEYLISKGIDPETYRKKCAERAAVVSEFCRSLRNAHENSGTSKIKYGI